MVSAHGDLARPPDGEGDGNASSLKASQTWLGMARGSI